MPKINILTEDLINKIAAGEVVERPASVVKELIENSLDAGATRISIDIQDSGKERIKVTDNGEGMDEDDAKNSILRHTTSKIKNDSDLFSINTLGFRGEALASIAAISQMSLTTKKNEDIEGFNIAIEGGEVISSGVIAAERGTTIDIRNLFFNTPARKKFLKTDPVELRHIVDVVINYALINKNVAFKLVHDGHELLNSPNVDDLRNNISSIYGVSLAKDLLEVDYHNEIIKINGYIAKPYQSRNDKNQQAVFVNGRWVRNENVTKAVYDAYHSTLFVNKHPVLVLNLEINPEKIDVNVHPNKTQIKIEQKEEVYQAVYNAVKETLKNNNLISVEDISEEQLTFSKPSPKKKFKPKSKYSFELSNQSIFDIKNEIKEHEDKILFSKDSNNESNNDSVTAIQEPILSSHNIKFPTMRIFGQIHKTFFVAETLGGLYYIDQHAAHERVLYERFMKQYMNQGVEVQKLLQGEVLEFSPSEKIMVQQNKEALDKFGFSLEEFGGNSYIIKTIPLLFGRLQPKEIIYEVLGSIKEEKEKISEKKEEVVTRMACRAAVMAGDILTNQEMERIIGDLAETELPYTCPHGRPTIIKVSVDELEKKFKRK